MRRHLFLCEPGCEGPLHRELMQEWTAIEAVILAPGFVQAELPRLTQLPPRETAYAPGAAPWIPALAWAVQTLPDAEELNAASIATWSELLGTRIIAALEKHDGPWRWHLFAYSSDEAALAKRAPDADPRINPVSPRRAALINTAMVDYLKHKQKRLLKTMSDPTGPWRPNEILIQTVLTSNDHGWWSLSDPAERHFWQDCVSRFSAGLVEIPNNKTAPARAFAKLAEAELHLDREIRRNEHCVDLGASPGSWTWWAVQRGANVLAIDRSALRGDLMRHPSVCFQKGDAFKFQPEQPVDWLLCDVAAFPERIYELLERWLKPEWCRNFVVTIKFRGVEDYPLLRKFKVLLSQSGYDFQLRKLNANKNEVTAMGQSESRHC